MMHQDEIEAVAERYDSHYAEYQRYLSLVDWEVLEEWQPIIWGVMAGESAKPFLCRFDWKQDGFVCPPRGEMPDAVKLVCYHAKRLNEEAVVQLLPHGWERDFDKRKREMLYGSDPLSVIELYEMNL